MFTIRRGKFEYYATTGGFVTLAEYSLIKWYPHYVTASQHMMKLDERGDVKTVPATDVLGEVVKGMFGLAPELVEFAHSRTELEMEDLSKIRDTIALRGGILELKDKIAQLQSSLKDASERERILMSEAEKLRDVMDDYDRVIKEIGHK